MRFAYVLAAVAALFTLAPAAPAHADGHTLGPLTVEHPWSRASAGPMARAGAAFMTIRNAGGADRLIAARADIAQRVELHTHTLTDDGVMRMREVEGGIPVPANGSVTLAPGGLHVMFMGLRAPLMEGESFPLTLVFETAGEVTVDVAIEGVAARAGDRGHGQGGHGN